MRDGPLVFEGAAGDAARSPSRSLRPGSLLSLGGVTEMATALMVLRLVEEGRVTLVDPLARYVPHIPGMEVDAFFKQLVAAPLGLDRCLFDMDQACAREAQP